MGLDSSLKKSHQKIKKKRKMILNYKKRNKKPHKAVLASFQHNLRNKKMSGNYLLKAAVSTLSMKKINRQNHYLVNQVVGSIS